MPGTSTITQQRRSPSTPPPGPSASAAKTPTPQSSSPRLSRGLPPHPRCATHGSIASIAGSSFSLAVQRPHGPPGAVSETPSGARPAATRRRAFGSRFRLGPDPPRMRSRGPPRPAPGYRAPAPAHRGVRAPVNRKFSNAEDIRRLYRRSGMDTHDRHALDPLRPSGRPQGVRRFGLAQVARCPDAAPRVAGHESDEHSQGLCVGLLQGPTSPAGTPRRLNRRR